MRPNLLPSRKALCITLPLLFCACAEQSPPGSAGPNDSDASSEDDDAGSEEETCTEGLTEDCDCDDGSTGRRRCTEGEFQDCRGCPDDSPSDQDGALCVPGHYTGTIDGLFHPQAGGIDGIVGPILPGVVDLPIGPAPLGFTLQKNGTEFFTVEGGCFDATSTNTDAGVPTEGEDAGLTEVITRMMLIGSIDCDTGKLDGEIRGYYESTNLVSLGMARKKYFFKGSISAVFDPATKTFKDGKWEAKEPPVLFGDFFAPNPGGGGTWEATVDDQEGTAGQSEEACLGERFPIETFPK